MLRQQEVQRIILLTILGLMMMRSLTAANGEWQFNEEQSASDQYAKLFGRVTGDNPTQDQFGRFQYQYVDYQPNCKRGGEPVCATNGVKFFHFENDCQLEAENMKLLFQYGTELEPTELERCMPDCDNIKCTTAYAPICAAPESGPHQGRGVTFANECEVRRRECISKETQIFLNRGPCRQLKTKSKSKGKRKYRRRSTTVAPVIESSSVASHLRVTLPAIEAATTTTTTTSSTTTPVPMRFHEYQSQVNPSVSVSRAVDAYNVYNIPDVGEDYNEITDSSLSLYLPGVGTVTDTPPSTTTTTTTTTTPRTTTSTTTTGLPYTSSTVATTLAPPTSTSTAKTIYSFIYIPYGTTSTTTEQAINVSDRKAAGNTSISDAIKSTNGNPIASSTNNTSGNTKPTNVKHHIKSANVAEVKIESPLKVASNAAAFKVNAKTTAQPKTPTPKPISKPTIKKK